MPPGIITLMGSGELTATMVEVHKSLLKRVGDRGPAVFIDTPAGFQLNVDLLADKAVKYFRERVGCSLEAASFKSAEMIDTPSARHALALIERAGYLLIGPGSPTYALRQINASPLGELLPRRVAVGACLVAASAAALTIGRLTVPVYEIYKVGEPLHWVQGLNLLGRFGFDMVVVPHWNNAEGGNHDTRRCFMGQTRFERMQAMIAEPSDILGLDEHTALIIDLAQPAAEVQGIGRVVLLRDGQKHIFTKGDLIPLAWLRRQTVESPVPTPGPQPPGAAVVAQAALVAEAPLWARLHGLVAQVGQALAQSQPEAAARVLLELEQTVWSGHVELQAAEALGAARDRLREAIALLGSHLTGRPPSGRACLSDLVTALLAWRTRLRAERRWDMADALRDCLLAAGVLVHDTDQGTSWSLRTEASTQRTGATGKDSALRGN